MKKKIILAGGTGFIGNYLKDKFVTAGFQVEVISRQQGHIHWNNEGAIIEALNGAEMLINLAGKSVNCRYNEKNKAEIFSSRTGTTAALGNAILKCSVPPKLWLNSSTATIYRHAEDRPMTEAGGELGSGFSVEVGKAWEKSFFDFRLPQTRQIAMRMAIVLGKDGGVIKPFTNLVKFGLGGKEGSGNQMFSWIHIEDVFETIQFLNKNESIAGIVNVAAPNPVTNKKLMQAFRKALRIPFGLPAPKWLLKIGAVMIGTETELLLKSRWVLPERLLQSGYTFKFETIDETLRDILAAE
jgi:uncharacterized protein (TIGR01777 family)